MLEKVSPEKKLPKGEYGPKLEELGLQLGEVQRRAREEKRPIIILFEGWRGAKRSEIINTLMQNMDARGFDVLSTMELIDVTDRPAFEFFWKNLPGKGEIRVYHRSWYYLRNVHEGQRNKAAKMFGYNHINAFEKVLTDDNYIILKYFLHLSEDEQKKNMTDEDTFGFAIRSKHLTEYGRNEQRADYKKFYEQYDKMLTNTDTNNAPWHVIAADSTKNATIEIMESIIENLTAKLDAGKVDAPVEARTAVKYDALSKIVPYQEMTKEEYKEKLSKYQKKLTKLQVEMYKRGISAVIGFEGWDAGGKGGAIRRLTSGLDPLGYQVFPVASPTAVENNYNYQWRFWIHLPRTGEISIFDRTWYGRLMVERLEGFAKPNEWARAYDEIKEMEKQWVDSGMVVCKFWLQIDKDEQLARFTERQNTPNKQWKITDEDWRNRDKWEAYEEAVNEMLVRTDMEDAPWVIVEGNNKYYARLKVMKTVIDLFEKRLAQK
ncbi:MAG: phosphate--AMP phosphotransferase [Phascolarctobacterium sp.]|nr:phosphate--AMP phosphotransferase [Phascolarctobacterium sp.]